MHLFIFGNPIDFALNLSALQKSGACFKLCLADRILVLHLGAAFLALAFLLVCVELKFVFGALFVVFHEVILALFFIHLVFFTFHVFLLRSVIIHELVLLAGLLAV